MSDQICYELNAINYYLYTVEELKKINASIIVNTDQLAVTFDSFEHTTCFETLSEINAFIEGIKLQNKGEKIQ